MTIYEFFDELVDKAENLNRKMNNPEYGYRKWVVVDIKGG